MDEEENNNLGEKLIEESNIEDSKIEDSEIESSEIKDSEVIDSEIRESKIEDSKIEDSRIIGEELQKVHIEERPKTSEEELMGERKEKIINFFKNKQIWVLGVLIIAVILGVYIRSMPMQDHGGNPGLWDITTNTWTLGPDLDPWLFTRYAKTIVEQGSLPKIDTMRNVPLGFDTSIETQLLPYMIAGNYYLVNLFGDFNIEFAAAIFPVIMFALTIISFFLFVREIFIRKSKKSKTRANIIALISTFLMIVIPVFLPRTVAGIPEKESAAFFFMFLAFYLFLKAWKSERLKKAVIFGILAGISTALMGLVSGLVTYILISIAAVSLLAFIIGRIKEKEIWIYCLWMITAVLLLVLFSNKYSNIIGLMKSNNAVIFITFLVFITHLVFTRLKVYKKGFFDKIKLPENIISLILAGIFGLAFIMISLGPLFIFDKINEIIANFINPTTGRWAVTVAENKQPYFTEWRSNFGPFIKNIPVLFWLFFVGSIILFKKMLNKIGKKDSWILTGFYILLLLGLIFSRYSPSSIFSGENFISKLFLFSSALIFVGSFGYYFMKYYKEKKIFLENINFSYLFIIFLLVLCIFTARSAVRLIMVLAPISSIFVGYLIVESIAKFRKTHDETWKIILGVIVILILLFSLFAFWNFYKTIKNQAYSFIPSHYNQQWQKAMKWVRDETPKESVFGHWWDYGYWVQSIGDRATVLDGGNAKSFWNHWMGRLVLTGDNQKDALEFLYNHNTTHFLIDSSDIGKYGAFSSIGSDEYYDRFSWIGTASLDESQTQEKNNRTIYVYPGGLGLDEDLIINEDGKEILLPGKNAGIGAIILPIQKINNEETVLQPSIMVVYQNKQYQVDLRYLYVNGKFVDFNSGIEACAYFFPKVVQASQGITAFPRGMVMYLSPRLMRGMLVQKYILNDPLNKFPNFKLIHTEQNLIIDELNQQGMNLPEFIYYSGIQGPIKIWEIQYTGQEILDEKYLSDDPSKYINWSL